MSTGLRIGIGVALLGAWVIAVQHPIRARSVGLTPLQNLFENTLVCQNHETKAVCHAWFDRDGHFYVFYDLGPQSRPVAPDGPFQFEGREGTYSVRAQGSGAEVCLHPATPPVYLAAQGAHEIFSEADCYPIGHHPVGENWNQADSRGREYTLWLMAGR